MPRCIECKYYQITWDRDLPYGCRKLNFKSKTEPAQYIQQVSGQPCLSFEQKLRKSP